MSATPNRTDIVSWLKSEAKKMLNAAEFLEGMTARKVGKPRGFFRPRTPESDSQRISFKTAGTLYEWVAIKPSVTYEKRGNSGALNADASLQNP